MKLRDGDLPIFELSRENLKTLIASSLKIQLKSWDKFDSIFQRIDPSHRGFVKLDQIIESCYELPPLTEVLPSTSSSPLIQVMSLLILSLSVDNLSTFKLEFSKAYERLVVKYAKIVKSFAYLLSADEGEIGGLTTTQVIAKEVEAVSKYFYDHIIYKT